jgi:hypothetical protein
MGRVPGPNSGLVPGRTGMGRPAYPSHGGDGFTVEAGPALTTEWIGVGLEASGSGQNRQPGRRVP